METVQASIIAAVRHTSSQRSINRWNSLNQDEIDAKSQFDSTFFVMRYFQVITNVLGLRIADDYRVVLIMPGAAVPGEFVPRIR